MTNREIAEAFDQVADLLEFKNSNPFRVRAYRNAARRLADLPESIAGIVADPDRDLTEIDGIGKDLADKINEFAETGSLTLLSDLENEFPHGVLALLRVPGLGPKKAAILHKQLGIASLEMLRAACEADQVAGVKGFGKKTQDKILAGIDLAAHAEDRMYWAHADVLVQELLAHMRKSKSVRRIEAAGSFRRCRETIGDVDLLADADNPDAVMDHLMEFDGVDSVLGRGETKLSLRLARGLQVDLRVVQTESFGAALQYFTGSKEHNVMVRSLAKDRGLKINEYGVFRAVDNTDPEEIAESSPPGKNGAPRFDVENYVAGRTEEEVYAALDLPWFPPEIREGRNEFKWAAAGSLPELIELDDLRGDLHMHTTASDGKASLMEMASAARARGLEYIAITDHSPRVSMARGLNAERLRLQWAEIDHLRQEFEDLRILKGIECDILERGGMDLPDEVLAEADWVIASIHYGQQQSREQITDRILGAIENPLVSIIAHPTGRLINRREAYAVDLDQIYAAAARHKKMLELNANPARLDLNDVACSAAKQLGIPIVISSDAHSIGGLDVLRYGVLQARRAGLTPRDVANTRPVAEFLSLLPSARPST